MTNQNTSPTNNRKLRLGDMLVNAEIITEEQLKLALAEQKNTGLKLGATLIAMEFIDEDGLLNFLSKQLKIPFVDLSSVSVNNDIVQQLPEAVARRMRVILLDINATDALIGMTDPTNIFAVDDLSRILKRRVKCAVVRESDLLMTIDHSYQNSEEISNLVEELDEHLSEGEVNLEDVLEASGETDTPVFRLLKSLFEDAVLRGASDVHIEPDEKVLRLRIRVDGVLQEQLLNEIRIAPALVQRLKILSDLDIAEKRIPQDGRFQIKVKRHTLDVRLSTLPIQFGEAVVMRLLDNTGGIPTLDKLGMAKDITDKWRSLIKSHYGLVLVTGPTGSGKTTTLYASLQELNTPERKIITAEDPVEFQMPRISQVQVNPKINLNFSTVLRTALRQDPDVIFIGEMRDLETAEIALRSAMTGHLVLSTLHTNSAAATVARLLDMGAQGFLMATALTGIIGQRLIRRVCSKCSTVTPLTDSELSFLAAAFPHIDPEKEQFVKGTGCTKCNNTGYSGRAVVQELLTIDKDLAAYLRAEDQDGFFNAVANKKDYINMMQRGFKLARSGVTTIQQAIELSGDEDSWGK